MVFSWLFPSSTPNTPNIPNTPNTPNTPKKKDKEECKVQKESKSEEERMDHFLVNVALCHLSDYLHLHASDAYERLKYFNVWVEEVKLVLHPRPFSIKVEQAIEERRAMLQDKITEIESRSTPHDKTEA